jgi:nitroimidazol reductase NimA-like FMN-containing flavoprotein (pyridoxamine 5'-phosphate oxidase superfamily)
MSEAASRTNDRQRMEQILCAESVGHVAMTDGDELYLLPLNYTYVDGRILFHCALEGKKLDMIRANPKVCFEVSRQEGQPAPHAGELCDAPFESVICWGTARIIDDVRERQRVLHEFQARYAKYGQAPEPIPLERAEKCGAVEITVTRMTGRRRKASECGDWQWEARGTA